MLVAPQHFQRRRVGLQGRLECLDGEGEYLNGQAQAVAGGERRVGNQRRRAGRTVDQGHALFLSQLDLLADVHEQVRQRQHLPGPAVALEGYAR